MPEYLAPGVFIEEIERGPKPIEGVATSTAALLGAAERGPTKPQLVTSYNQYLRTFGDTFGTENYLPYAVKSFFDNGGRRTYIARVAGENAATASAELAGFKFTATGPGGAYNRVHITVAPGSTKDSDGDAIGFRVVVAYWEREADNTPFDPIDPENKENPPGPLPSALEDFDDLSLDPRSQSYFEKRINNGNSAYVEIEATDGVALPTGTTAGVLEDGADGDPPVLPHFAGEHQDPNQATGLAALDLDPYREVAIVYAPAVADDIAKAVITHCERNRFRFAVIDSQPNQAVASNLDPRTNMPADSTYAAFYYPWIYISDPQSGARTKVPPGGAVCGIYAPDRQHHRRVQGAGQRSGGRRNRPRVRHHPGHPGGPQPPGGQRHPPLPRARHSGLGRSHHVERPALEVRERSPALHLPRSLHLQLDTVGGVRAQRSSTVGPGQADHHPLPPQPMA